MLPAQSPALCRRSEGWVLFWFVFPPPFFISPVLFVSLALWVGIAATCWLSDSWADCLLTVPSPEQKGRRGSLCLPSTPASVSLEDSWPFSTPSASSGEARAEVVFKDCPALQLQQGGSGTPRWQRLALACCHSCSLPTGLAPLWSFWKVPSQPPVSG